MSAWDLGFAELFPQRNISPSGDGGRTKLFASPSDGPARPAAAVHLVAVTDIGPPTLLPATGAAPTEPLDLLLSSLAAGPAMAPASASLQLDGSGKTAPDDIRATIQPDDLPDGHGGAPSAVPSDSLFGQQWFLRNTGQAIGHFAGGTPGIDIDVVPVWNEYTGAGIHVGIYDTGVQYTHPDLAPNYDASLEVTLSAGNQDPMPVLDDPEDTHGTAVAGLIAAANDGTGTVGVAYGAKITAIKINDSTTDSLSDWLIALNAMATFDITNNSNGYAAGFDDDVLSTTDFWTGVFAAYENAIEHGRGGLGTIMMKSAGNDRTSHGNSGAARDANDSGFDNSRYRVTIAAIDYHGDVTNYSTPGAALFVAAPSGGSNGTPGLWTTDLLGAQGYNAGHPAPDQDSFADDDATPDYDGEMNGTSGSTPIVAGVVALMLQANPTLGWRDVEAILADTARHVGTAIGTAHSTGGTTPGTWELYDWGFNAATNWNGGGLHFSNDYGYGLVDAYAAVRLAERWTTQLTSANEHSAAASLTGVNEVVPDADTFGVTNQIAIADPMDVEHVELEIDWLTPHTRVGDLIITLTSPEGTTSTLLNRLGTAFGGTASDADLGNWVFSSNAFRGETGNGNWTVRVVDAATGETGTISNFKLALYGQAKHANDVYVYTKEFHTYAGAGGHGTTLSDTDGGTDTINTSTIASATTINLSAGASSSIDGVAVTSIDGNVENVVSGDGADSISGNAKANHLEGMRGDDSLFGGAGSDVIDGGAGTGDVAAFAAAWAQYTITKSGSGYKVLDKIAPGDIDTVRNVEKFSFGGLAFNAANVLNVAPVAVHDVVNTPEDRAVTLGSDLLLVNDTDANLGVGDRLSLVSTGAATHGSLHVTVTTVISVTFTPQANYHGDASFSYTVQDAAGLASTASVTVHVGSVNDAPTGTDKTITVKEDGSHTFAAADFGFHDTKDIDAAHAAGNSFVKVIISKLPAHGTLKLGSTTVTAGKAITVSDLGSLKWAPAHNENASGYATLGFKVVDNGGTSNDGVNTDPSTNTIKFNVTAVDDAPRITSNGAAASVTLTVRENTTAVTTVKQTDIDSSHFAYSLSGADAGKFTISTKGVLAFRSAPDFERPGDADKDHAYSVKVTVKDDHTPAGSDSQIITVRVTDVKGAVAIGTGGADTIDKGHGVNGKFATNEQDRIDGKGGNDTLTGRGGADAFIFSTTPNTTTNVDKITDFTRGEDVIDLHDTVFKGVALDGKVTNSEIRIVASSTSHGATNGKHLIYNATDGGLWYDADGVYGGEVKFAVLSNKPLSLDVHDFAIV